MPFGFLTKVTDEATKYTVRDPQLIKKARNELLDELRDLRHERKDLKREKKGEKNRRLGEVIMAMNRFVKDDELEAHHVDLLYSLLIVYATRKIKTLLQEIKVQSRLPSGKEEVPKLQKELEEWRQLFFREGAALESVGKTG